MLLEAIADKSENDFIELALIKDDNGLLKSDWSALLPVIINEQISRQKRAAIFHNSMARTLIKQAMSIAEFYQYEAIGLSGGVFQNRFLTEKIIALAKVQNIHVHLPEVIPANDGGLSFGQVIEYLGGQK